MQESIPDFQNQNTTSSDMPSPSDLSTHCRDSEAGSENDMLSLFYLSSQGGDDGGSGGDAPLI